MRRTIFLRLHPCQFETGDIDHDIIIAELFGHPAPAFHICDDLEDPVLDLDVEGEQALLADHTIRIEAVAFLKPPHRLNEPIVVNTRFRAARFKVAGGLQPCPHLCDPWVIHARFQGVAWIDARPAAGVFKCAVLREHHFQCAVLRALRLPIGKETRQIVILCKFRQGLRAVNGAPVKIKLGIDLGRHKAADLNVCGIDQKERGEHQFREGCMVRQAEIGGVPQFHQIVCWIVLGLQSIRFSIGEPVDQLLQPRRADPEQGAVLFEIMDGQDIAHTLDRQR